MSEPRAVADLDATIDPVTAEVVRSAMETVCFEMATHVSRTATTPILNQSNERNATILDANGRLAALSVGIPQFMLSSTLPVQYALELFGDELVPGDVIVANDPYHGGGHLPDFNVFAPVFDDDGELLLIASIQCHHGDTGGAMAGGYNVFAKDIWSEGTRYPALKIIDGGKERKDVVALMRANNRLPGFIGDLRSQVGAAQLGVRRLREIATLHGADAVRATVEWSIEDTRRRMQAEIGKWPDGTYEADVYVDADPSGNTDIHVHVAVTVDGDHLTVDFTGSDERPNIQAWSTFGNTRGNVVSQLASLVDPTIPKNEGFFDSIEIIAPLGSCVNPVEGKPVSSGTHHPGVEVSDVIAVALSQVIPDRCCPQTYKFGSPRQMWGDEDPRTGRSFFDHGGEVSAGWVNGVKGVDGWGAMVAANGNLIKASAEINEGLFPHILRGRNYRTDSGGAGQWRGACGSLFVKEVRTPTYINQYVVNRLRLHPGIAGGNDGTPDRCLLGHEKVEVAPSVANFLLDTGEQLRYEFGGGGGWGDPLARDPAAVLDDVWDEYVSVEGARRDYGVVITGSLEDMTLAIDDAATEAERASRRVRPLTSASMRLGIITPVLTLLPRAHAKWERTGTLDDVVEIAQAADRLGYDHLTCSEHVVVPDEVATVRGGRYWDPAATLGFLAARTERIRLATSVLVLGYHHPLEIAKRYGTLDRVSGGRLVLGVGVGSLREEFDLIAASFDDRGARADDSLRALRGSISDPHPSYRGEYFSYDDVVLDPCAQQDHVPIWVGGRTARSLRRAVELADGWCPFGLAPDEIAAMLGRARDTEAWSRRDRALDVVLQPQRAVDPSGDAEASAATLAMLRDAGATALSLRFVHHSPQHYIEQMEAMTRVE